MPLYNSTTTATALGVTQKWLDNLLSHNNIPGLDRAAQGVSRRLPVSVIKIVALTRELVDTLGLPSGTAIEIAQRLLATPGGTLNLSPVLTLVFRPEALQDRVLDGLALAVETSPHPPRGRPRKS